MLFVAGLDGDQNAYRDFLLALTRHLRGYLHGRQAPADPARVIERDVFEVSNRKPGS
ncbi:MULTISPECIES: hypothetical protein [unclassified Caballeronia]|uniref:hypothetical protein n=1 Tax=unclassified Caballeronia TaxID=2646786 RepID=UPI003857537F